MGSKHVKSGKQLEHKHDTRISEDILS